jgi:hypothetical protein
LSTAIGNISQGFSRPKRLLGWGEHASHPKTASKQNWPKLLWRLKQNNAGALKTQKIVAIFSAFPFFMANKGVNRSGFRGQEATGEDISRGQNEQRFWNRKERKGRKEGVTESQRR